MAKAAFYAHAHGHDGPSLIRGWDILACVLIIGCHSSAPVIHTDSKPAATPAQLCLAAANDCTAAIVSSDEGPVFEADKVLACVAHQAIPHAGGRDAIIAFRRKQRAAYAMKAKLSDEPAFMGKHIKNELPTSITRRGDLTFAIVPRVIMMDMPSGTFIRDRTFVLGVSPDDGRSWKFVDGLITKNLSRARIAEMFPTFPEAVMLPQAHADLALVDADGTVLAVPNASGKWPWSDLSR